MALVLRLEPAVTRRRKSLVGLSIAALVVIGAFVAVRWYAVDVVGESDLHVLRVLLMKRFYLAPIEDDATPERRAVMATDVHSERAITLDPRLKPFREIGAKLGARAGGNQIFRTRGAVIADFNGDGKMDLFLPQSGQTVGQVTEKNVLTDKPLPNKPCVLYLNQGNDADGNPILVAIQDLEARGNQKNVRAELLIENKYKPRESVKDDEFAVGRMSTGAVAADFNGDGRLDLWVTDDLAGLPFTTEETALRGYPAQRNIGREERKRAITIRLPQFLRHPLVDGRLVRVNHSVDENGHHRPGKGEWEGRDSLFINLGDTDGDGIPEWKDVTDEAGVGGRWASFSVAVADVDLDGDLDVFVANYQDPDFYGFGMRRFGGNQSELYLNQLAETGKLTFKSAEREWHVSGLIEEEHLKASMWFPSSPTTPGPPSSSTRTSTAIPTWSSPPTRAIGCASTPTITATALFATPGSTTTSGKAAGWAPPPAISTATAARSCSFPTAAGSRCRLRTWRCSTKSAATSRSWRWRRSTTPWVARAWPMRS